MSSFISIIVGFLMLFFINDVMAYSSYYNQSPIGWHWNNNIEPAIEKKAKQNKQVENGDDPVKKMHRIHQLLNYYKDKAVLNPTVENIKEYLVIQNMIMRQSTTFEDNWKKTMLLYPEFNYGITHPTDSAISQISQSNLHDKMASIVKAMPQQYGLLFFYNGNNPLSPEMEKTILYFSKFYGFSTIAVSVDGKIISGGLQSHIDHGQAESLGVKALPAIVLVNPKTGAHAILAYGYASEDDLLVDCYNAYSGLTG